MAHTQFGVDVRYLTCKECGASLEVPVSGGQVTCEYCGNVFRAGGRHLDQIHLSDPTLDAHADPEAREGARIMSLRAQAAGYDSDKNIYAYYDAPRGLEHLELESDDPSLPALLQQAFAQAVARLEASGGSLQDQRHVYWIARKIKNMWSQRDEPLRARPAIETASELLTDPGYRQIMRCALADLARRGGDVEAAEAWLSGCDPRPPLLDLDSDFRTSSALVAVYKNEWARALEVVGAERDLVPFEPSSVPLSIIIRCACLEVQGQSGRAEREMAWLVDHLDEDFLAAWMNRNRDCPLVYASVVWDRVRAQATSSASFEPEQTFDVTSTPQPKTRSRSWIIGVAIAGAVVPLVIFLVNSGGEGCGADSSRYDPAARAAVAQPVAIGQAVQGALGPEGYSVYALTMPALGDVTISVTSSWDNYIEVFPANGAATLIEDDDSGGGLNASCHTILQPGVYHIVVRPYSSGSGPFTMMVAGSVMPAAPPMPVPAPMPPPPTPAPAAPAPPPPAP